MKKRVLFLLPILALLLSVSLSAHATLIESGLPGGGPDLSGLQPGETGSTITPSQYIRYLYLFVMGFIGIAGLVTLVIWGTVWTASGVIDKKTMAMEGIKNTLYGIGVALFAYILLYTINPDLTVIKTPTLKVGTTKPAPSTEYSWKCPPLESTDQQLCTLSPTREGFVDGNSCPCSITNAPTCPTSTVFGFTLIPAPVCIKTIK